MKAILAVVVLQGLAVWSEAQTSKPENPRPREFPRAPASPPSQRTGEPAPSPAQPATPTKKKEPAVFRVSGSEAWAVASRAGWKFSPKGGLGAMDGRGTVAQIHPGVNSSVVNGPKMTQMRTPAQWGRISQNTFYMFADAAGRPKPLAKGWTVRELELVGGPFQWLVRPRAGATSPFFAIEIAGGRSDRDTTVEVAHLVLQGPPDASTWREAFESAE